MIFPGLRVEGFRVQGVQFGVFGRGLKIENLHAYHNLLYLMVHFEVYVLEGSWFMVHGSW